MSESAYKIYNDAETDQRTRNEARRILSRVDQARKSPHSAGVRWPFELLQNTLDAGPRDGRPHVEVGLKDDGATVVFQHDGAPFRPNELAALVSGGSSKEYDSEETTGRFGTGFLVTHVLAERVRLRGLLGLDSHCEAFDMTLDRSGDENAILANMGRSQEAIRTAVAVADTDNSKSAILEYTHGGSEVFSRGMDELRRTLPYVYGTRQMLGCLELRTSDGQTERWTPTEVVGSAIEGGYLESREIAVVSSTSSRDLRILRFSEDEHAAAAALVLIEVTGNNIKVLLPDQDAPRVYREYPLRSSGFLPTNFIIDGKFEPDQERGSLLMDDTDNRHLIDEAFAAGVLATRYAVAETWRNAHWLAYATRPDRGFEAVNSEETVWWMEALGRFVQGVARSPIVRCESQVLPALADEGPYADFIVPRLLADVTKAETSVERLWPLVNATKDLLPPVLEVAKDWSAMAEGWWSLDADVNLVSVEKLAEWVRDDAETLEELRVEGDARSWLAAFLDVVGECWSRREGVKLEALERMMPNQNGRLCSPSDVKRDMGVPMLLKDICASVGYDVRDHLLLEGLDKGFDNSRLEYATSALADAVPDSLDEEDVVEGAIARMGRVLPDDKVCNEVGREIKHATVRLLAHLWESKGEEATSVAKRVPLLTKSQRAVRSSEDRRLMAPALAGHEGARPFERAYPPDRVLDDLYCGCEGSVPSVVTPLVHWGLAYADPIVESTVNLQGARLQRLSRMENTEGMKVPPQSLSQVALLTPEVLNRCQENREDAQALLGLVLCYVARRDPAWKEERTVTGTLGGEEVSVALPGALWLADLKVRAWVPVLGEDDKPQKMVASAATLAGLLDPTWLENNGDAIRLLSDWFGFDRLDLRLLGIAQDEQDRRELRDSLAQLVESGGANPQLYKDLAEEVLAKERRSRDVSRCRQLGIAVQGAVGAALRRRDLEVTLVDRGFDYEVDLPSDDVYQDARSGFQLGPSLVEVKATTTGHPRLTSKQAATSAQQRGRYVLCVVDLRAVDEPSEVDWTAENVEGLVKLVPDIGEKVGETFNQVEEATTLDVSITNESALRYEVAVDIWESGITIDDWVGRIAEELKSRTVEGDP